MPRRVLLLQAPLLSLACCACWVLETLAHHSENAGDWISLVHAAEGFVELVAREARPTEPEGVAARLSQERSVVLSLYKMYETLRQCEPEGYVSRQLGHRYDKAFKAKLKRDWAQRLVAMRDELAASVIGMLVFARERAAGGEGAT